MGWGGSGWGVKQHCWRKTCAWRWERSSKGTEAVDGESFNGCWESNPEKDDEGLLKMISPAKSVCLVLRRMSKY